MRQYNKFRINYCEFVDVVVVVVVVVVAVVTGMCPRKYKIHRVSVLEASFIHCIFLIIRFNGY